MARPRKPRDPEPVGEAAERLAESLRSGIVDAEAIHQAAKDAGSHQAASNALALRQRLEEKLARIELAGAAASWPLSAKLEMEATLAIGDGSWGPLVNIRKTQAAHAEEIERIRAARAEAEMATLGADELVGVIVGAIAEASIEDVRRIMDAAQSRLTPRLVEG